MTEHAKQAVEMIKQRVSLTPKIGIVLGSGLGAVAEKIENATVIPYTDLPGFPACSVAGHGGNLFIGELEGVPVACLQGRAHLYEGIEFSVIKTLIRSLKLLGCETLLATNSSGSLRETVGPGSLVAISDQINFQFNNPLVGPNDDEFGDRFHSMENAYDDQLRAQLQTCAKNLGITLHEGTYIGVIGPSFETPAEIYAYKTLGADVVGMSTVADTIIARHCGLRVATVSAITNFAAGMHSEQLSHDVTLAGAKVAAEKLIPLILEFVKHHS